MRIRNIKPEFWRSDDIASLSFFDRLLFIGLWSYVDDNGVGRYHLIDICADLFAQDLAGDPRETLRRLSEGLGELAEHGLIQIYSAGDDEKHRYIFITNWEKHQRVHNPNRPRYPRPSNDSKPLAGDSTESLGISTENLGTGSEGQGDRGTDNNPPVVPPSGDAPDDDASKPKKHKAVKTSLPDDWHPNAHHADVARKQGCDLVIELEKFKASAEANARTYANWDQAFNNWLLNTTNFNRGKPGVYVNRAQQRFDANMRRVRAVEATHASQPQLTGGADNDFGY